MGASERVRMADVHQLLDLVNEAMEIPPDDPTARKQHLLSGLCQLVGAQVAVLNLTLRKDDGSIEVVSSHDQGWSGQAERNALVEYYVGGLYNNPRLRDPMDDYLARYYSTSDADITIQREQLMSEEEWYRHPAIDIVRRPGRINHFVNSTTTLKNRKYISGVGVHRPWNDRRRFTRRERNLAELFSKAILFIPSAEVKQLSPPDPLTSCRNDPAVGSLSPRLQRVLAGLLEGLSEKQIAASMGLSRHTIHDYVKALYKRLDATSRGELLARFVRRD